MVVLHQKIALYEERRADLERKHNGAWALIHQDKIIGVYPVLFHFAERSC